ncbi:LLM class flavin-dependent oxidoreductase [Longispora albida]|uniref:LLM class flavin-dependent oxidoreductase n=1 Tax=Longispora albida TaxID=203523 RepID=UPI0003692002|nr:LLM class flavin-dependent oxidoreductase [Longispora albida]
MRIGVIVPMTTAGWPEISAYAQHAEATGADSAWVFDHLYSGHGDVPPEDIQEAWTVQSALAAVTSRMELGQLVTCATFRPPGLLAKMAATVDGVSGGRLVLGIGAGWYDREYRDFGYPNDHRASRFAEAVDIIKPLLAGEKVTVAGRWHSVTEAELLPRPARRVPLLIAGFKPRMLRLAARHADAWNTAWHPAPNDIFHQRLAAFRAALEAEGRDPATIRLTVGMHAPQATAAELAKGIAAFGGYGIDDLIVMQEEKTPAALDMLAEARALL